MRMSLTDAIVNHIFDNLGLTIATPLSLKSDSFILDKTIEYVNENGVDSVALLWGSQINIDTAKFRLMVADFSNTDLEFALIVKLEGCPSYGCYLTIDAATGDPCNGMICFSLKENVWLNTNPGIQGTFLAGMENLKEITKAWNKLQKTDDLLEELKSFIQYQDSLLNDEDE